MSKPTYNQVKHFRDKAYAQINFQVSKDDKPIIKKYCDNNKISMNNYIYNLIINDLTSKGIKLYGTITMRNNDYEIYNDDDA